MLVVMGISIDSVVMVLGLYRSVVVGHFAVESGCVRVCCGLCRELGLSMKVVLYCSLG